MLPTPCRRTRASTLKAISGNESAGLTAGRMQFRRSANDPVLDISDYGGAVFGAFRGVTFDKPVIQKTIEAIVSACRIEP